MSSVIYCYAEATLKINDLKRQSSILLVSLWVSWTFLLILAWLGSFWKGLFMDCGQLTITLEAG